jgi:proline iminopeptidase
MRARVRDTELYFDIDGPGLVPVGDRMQEQPVVFAIHGGPGSDHARFKAALPALTDKAQIVYFDHRGQGRSARGDPQSYTLDNNVEDMEALRQYLGLGQIVPLGVSYGGIVALSYAIRYPQHVAQLIIVATTASYHFLARAREILTERGTPEQQAIAQRLWEGSFENDEQLRAFFDILGPLYSRTYDAERARQQRNRNILSYEATNVAFSSFLRTFDLTAQLAAITAPTLVIGGRYDWICAPEFSAAIADRIPDADLRICEHSGHAILSDEPQAFLDMVRGFLTYKVQA